MWLDHLAGTVIDVRLPAIFLQEADDDFAPRVLRVGRKRR